MSVNYRIIIILLLAMVLVWDFSPILSSSDSYLYAEISAELAKSGGFAFLTHLGADWLDKPHFPFWVTAIFFRMFGIGTTSYMLSGFVFYTLGGIYTYRLAKQLYNQEVALLSTLVYFSVLRICLVAIDLRAECFLLGEIVPAAFYWLRFYQDKRIITLNAVFGAIFSACAVMTKGVFVIVPIFSGLAVLAVYYKIIGSKDAQRLPNLLIKLLIAILMIGLLIMPELLSLYLQFDLHPEKVVFNKQNVSGLKWFFWGSQFGRFLNTGEITKGGGGYLFFTHTFLWSFLPWTFICILGWYSEIKALIQNFSKYSNGVFIYLGASFLIPFIMFSLSKFQLDFYIVILFPFAAITTGNYLYQASEIIKGRILVLQVVVTLLMLSLFLLFVGHFNPADGIRAGLIILAILFMVVIAQIFKFNLLMLNKIILITLLNITIVFTGLMIVNNTVYAQYDVGYRLYNTIQDNDIADTPIAVYGIDPILIDQIIIHNPHTDVMHISDLLALQDEYQRFLLADSSRTTGHNLAKYTLLVVNNDEATISNVKTMFPQTVLLSQYSFMCWEHFFDVLVRLKHLPKNINVYYI